MKNKLLLPILVILLPALAFGGEKFDCPFNPPEPVKYCKTTGMSAVPKDLPKSITTLDMENNDVSTLTSDSFKPYRFLKKLNLQGNSIEVVSPDAFSGLKYLIELNLMLNTEMKTLTNLPSSLESLDLSKCYRLNHNGSSYLSNLKSLKRLILVNAKLTEIPRLNDVAGSLKTLNIDSNAALTKIRLADLAPLCKLENLIVTMSMRNDDLCECLAVQQWIRQNDIKGSNITCGGKGKIVACERPVDLTEYENMRRNCQLTWTWKTYWIYGAGVFLILVCVICCSFVCKRMKCNQISVLDEEET